MKIKYQLYKTINRLLDKFNIRLETKSYIEYLKENQSFVNDLDYWNT